MDLNRRITQAVTDIQGFLGNTSSGISENAEIRKPVNLPIWMNDAAHYATFPYHVTTGKIQVTLIIPKKEIPFEKVINLYRVFSRMESGPALILADDLNPKVRGVLVRMGIPHVVTSHVIFAPNLGVTYRKLKDLSDEITAQKPLSAIGLKLTAAYLLQPHYFKNNPTLSEIQERLKQQGKYSLSVATLSRAFQELQKFELIEMIGRGPNKRAHFKEREQTWKRLLEIPVETVVRQIETRNLPSKSIESVLSGDSALGKLSDLIQPDSQTIALSLATYRKWKISQNESQNPKLKSIDWNTPPHTIELWREDPLFLQEKGCINIIQLVLSLRSHRDERVQIALSQILENHKLSSTAFTNTEVPDEQT